MFRAEVARGLCAGLVAADEHHVDTAYACLGFGDIATEVQGGAAGLASALGFGMAGRHGLSVRPGVAWITSIISARIVRCAVVRSID